MKKLYVFLVLIMAAIILPACTNNSKSIFANEIDQMSYQMLSGIQMLESSNKFSDTLTVGNEVAEKKDIEKYLTMMENLLNNNGGFSSETLTSDKPDYEKLVKVITSDLKGNSTEYLMYFNETETTIRDDDDDDDDDWDDRFDKDDEVETRTTINGIAISNGVTYILEGIKVTEVDGRETEEETTFKIITDNLNYCIVSTETENEFNESENSFSYQLVQNGKTINRVEFEIEKEGKALSIELKEKNSGSQKTSYEFDIVTINNVKYIRVKIMENGSVTVVHVKAVLNTETNEYTYEYKYSSNANTNLRVNSL